MNIDNENLPLAHHYAMESKVFCFVLLYLQVHNGMNCRNYSIASGV